MSHHLTTRLFVVVPILCVASIAFGVDCPATFTQLQVLANGNETYAYGVSPDGSVVVGRNHQSTPCVNCVPWKWSVSGPGNAVPPGNIQGDAVAASVGGLVIIGDYLEVNAPFAWSAATGMQLLPILPGYVSEDVFDISGTGTRIVGKANGSNEQALLIDNGVPVGLGTLPGGIASAAYGISLDGSTIVGYSRSGTGLSTWKPMRWTARTGMVGLGPLPVNYNFAVANVASSDGSVIAGTLMGSVGWFRWTEETGVVKLPLASGAVTGISGDGTYIIGNGQLVPNGETGPIIWDCGHGARLLRQVMTDEWGVSLTGWTLSSVSDISTDGRTLVGFGFNPQSFRRAWSVVRAPPPFADLNGDCLIDAKDICVMLASWGNTSGPADLNADGIVDAKDLGLLLGAWKPA